MSETTYFGNLNRTVNINYKLEIHKRVSNIQALKYPE